jgi:membrane-bound lytic murein transglycosylase B
MSTFWVKAVMLLSVLGTQMSWADYSHHPQALSFVDELVTQDHFDRAQLMDLMQKSEYQQSIIDAISRPAEKVKTWKEYRPIFLTQSRIDKGKAFWQDNLCVLYKAEQYYGVPAQMITAIIGIETQYGINTGKYRVMDALATLAFDYTPRSAFFRKELREFMLLTREENIEDPLTLMGSYAGAMGYGQFMPSSFRAYAVDFDGDGKRDIWNNPADAIGSIANYFAKHGWESGQLIASPVEIKGNNFSSLVSSDLALNTSVNELKQQGVTPIFCLMPDTKTMLMQLEGEDGPEFWIGLKNFQVITTYNRSQLYAMAAFELSEAIGD